VEGLVGDVPGSLGRGRGPLPRVGEVGKVVGEGRGRLLSRGLAGAVEGGDERRERRRVGELTAGLSVCSG
jgi:hypothetical protein